MDAIQTDSECAMIQAGGKVAYPDLHDRRRRQTGRCLGEVFGSRSTGGGLLEHRPFEATRDGAHDALRAASGLWDLGTPGEGPGRDLPHRVLPLEGKNVRSIAWIHKDDAGNAEKGTRPC